MVHFEDVVVRMVIEERQNENERDTTQTMGGQCQCNKGANSLT